MSKHFLNMILCVVVSACASISSEEVNFNKVSIEEPKDLSLEDQFVAEEITPDQLKAFETRAIEKLKDFADYILILSDSTYAEGFRANAETQASKLFIELSEINLFDEQNNLTVENFLSTIKELKISRLEIIEPNILQPLHFTTKDHYKGLLSFKISISGDQFSNPSQTKTADFFLMKKQKSFGTHDMMVWEISLGDIR